MNTDKPNHVSIGVYLRSSVAGLGLLPQKFDEEFAHFL
jgi:hypothetical protein